MLGKIDLHTVTGGAGLALRATLGAAISFGLAKSLGLQYPIYALVAAIIVTDFVSSETTRLGMRRLVGTVVGAICGAALGSMLEPNVLTVGLGIFVSILVCYLTKAQDGARIAGFTAALVMLDHGKDPWTYGFFRFIETALGIGVAWLISLVPRLIRLHAPASPEPSALQCRSKPWDGDHASRPNAQDAESPIEPKATASNL